MVFYSLKDVVFFFFGSFFIYFLLSFINFPEFIDDASVLAFSTLFFSVLIGSLRGKLFLSMKFKFVDVKLIGFVVSLIFVVIVFSSPFFNEVSFTYGAWSFFRISFVSPLCEEVIFRGVLLGFFMGCLRNKFISIFFVSLIFSFMHDSDVFLYSFLMSFGLCFLRVSANSISPGIVIHSLNNIYILLNGDFV